MGAKIAIIAAVIILVLFFLSVFAPMQSQKKFWTTIHKIRAVMDLISYWFINLCAIFSISYLVWNVTRGLLLR